MPRPHPYCLVALALLAACSKPTSADAAGKDKPKADTRPPLVRVRGVELRKVQREIRDTAYLEAERRVTLQTKVAGRIAEVFADDGLVVTKGQVLAKLDDRESKTTLAQVEVQLAEAKLRHDLSLLEAEASSGRLQQARIERDMASAEWKRNSAIDPQVISPKTLDDSKFMFEKSEESLRIADFGKRKADIEVKAAANKVAELTNRLDEVKLQLAEHTIIAPFDGVLVERKVTGGETVNSSTTLFVLVDPSSLFCYISRPQRELPLVRGGKVVLYTTDAHPGREFTGDIDMVRAVVDEATGSFKLRMRVKPEDTKDLLAGMFVRVRILTEDLREAVMVPKGAVLADGERSVVFVVRDGKAIRVTLDPGIEERDWIECKNRGDDALAPQDKVIVSGHEDLKDQTLVELSVD